LDIVSQHIDRHQQAEFVALKSISRPVQYGSSVPDNNPTQHPLRTQKSHSTSSVGFCTQTADPGVRVANLLKVKVTNVLLPRILSQLKIVSRHVCESDVHGLVRRDFDQGETFEISCRGDVQMSW